MSKPAFRIARLFGEIALKAAGVVVGLQLTFNFLAFNGRGEKLTPGEEEMVQTFFSDENTDNLRKHYLRKGEGFAGTVVGWIAGDNTYAVNIPLGPHIVFFEETHAKDYSKRYAQGRKRAIFMHEMAHKITQSLPSLKNLKCYNYKLSGSSQYDDFGDEQQANMVQDYFLRFTCDKPYSVEYQNREGQDKSEADSLLARVVEAEYPGAKILRREAEQRRLANSR
jgi:hypothetical protein